MVLRLRLPAPDWGKAKCLGTAPPPGNDPWFDNSDDGYDDLTHEGVQFCNGDEDGVICPIRHECLIFALVNNERYGVYGGTSETDRRAIRKMWPWPGGAEPHDEWKWYPPGEVAKMLPPKGRAALDQEEEDDEDTEAQL